MRKVLEGNRSKTGHSGRISHQESTGACFHVHGARKRNMENVMLEHESCKQFCRLPKAERETDFKAMVCFNQGIKVEMERNSYCETNDGKFSYSLHNHYQSSDGQNFAQCSTKSVAKFESQLPVSKKKGACEQTTVPSNLCCAQFNGVGHCDRESNFNDDPGIDVACSVPIRANDLLAVCTNEVP